MSITLHILKKGKIIILISIFFIIIKILIYYREINFLLNC